MKKRLLLIFNTSMLCLGLASSVQAQVGTVQSEYVMVNGTNISMTPPRHFDQSPTFKGFQDSTNQMALIMVMEIPGPLQEVSKGFNKAQMEPRGLFLNGIDTIQIDQKAAYLIEFDQTANGVTLSKAALLFGNEASTTMVNGMCPKDSTKLFLEIKNSLKHTQVDWDLEIDPRATLSYTIDETLGGFKFHSVISNGMLFNRDGNTPTLSPDSLFFFCDESFTDLIIEDQEAFCYKRIAALNEGYKVLEGNAPTPIELEGLKGYELLAENETTQILQVILFKPDGGYFIFIGSYAKGFESSKSDINKVIHSFSRK